jgi:hypothetical protein
MVAAFSHESYVFPNDSQMKQKSMLHTYRLKAYTKHKTNRKYSFVQPTQDKWGGTQLRCSLK